MHIYSISYIQGRFW